MDNKYKAVIVGILLVLSLFAAGCAQQGDEGEETDNGADEQKNHEYRLCYVGW